MIKVFVNIDFKHKESAKRAGAKWDWVNKSWYFENAIPPSFRTGKQAKSFEQRLAEAKQRYKEKNKVSKNI